MSDRAVEAEALPAEERVSPSEPLHDSADGRRSTPASLLALQRTAGNAAVCGLLRAQRHLARQPAGADDDVIAQARWMLSNDRSPDAMMGLLRKFGKGRVAAPQKHVTMLAAGARGYAFKYLAASNYLSIGEDFVERLARADVDALKSELANVIAEIDGPSPAAAAAPTQAEQPKPEAPAAAPGANEPRKKKEAKNPRNGPFRQRVKELLAPIQTEVKEGSAEFEKLLPAWQVKYERESKAREHYAKGTDVTQSKYSTCITFMNNVINEAKKKAGGQVKRIGSDAETEFKNVPGAWYSGAEAASYDPEEGDIYVFYFAPDHPTKPNQFSHTGFIRSMGPVGTDGMQTWVTVDAGQGTAGALRVTSATPAMKDGNPVLKDNKPVINYTYEVVIKGAESIKARVRTYDTKKKLMLGGENEDKDPRVLRGWVDIDQAVTLDKPK